MRDILSVVMFSTSSCPNCVPMKETLSYIKGFHEHTMIYKINEVDTNPAAMKMAKHWGIQAVPTTILLMNGEEKARVVGNHPREAVGELIERFIQPDVLQEQSGGSDDTSGTLLLDSSQQIDDGEGSS